MRLDRVYDRVLLAEATREVGADDGVVSLDFAVDRLADVMQQAGPLRGNRVEPELACHDAAQVRDLERVVEHVLPVRSTVAQTTERVHELGVHVMDARVERRLLSSFLNALVHELLGLLEHLLDARRVDAPVRDEVLHRDAADLATNRIEARDSHAFGRVVDDEVRARDLLERADVATFATDDAALEVVRRDLDGRNRVLDRVV